MNPRTDPTTDPTENHVRTTRSPLLVLLTVLLAALALTACGGGGGDDGDGADVATLEDSTDDEDGGTTTSTTVDLQAQMLAYARCMRGEGIDYPDPGPDGDLRIQVEPGQEAAVRAAEEACKDHRPTGRELSDEEEAEMYDGLLALATCLREAGFDVPDPVIGPDGLQFLIPGGGSGSNPELDAAVASCRAEGGGDEGPGGLAGG